MSHFTRIYLARHGETHWNVEKRLQGQCDSELTQQGIKQANTLIEKSRELGISQIISSNLGRAQSTAEIIAQALKQGTYTFAGLEERHFGLWQGKQYSAVADQPYYYQIFNQVTDHQPPSGESALAAVARFSMALKDIIKQSVDDLTLVISHGDIMRCFLSSLGEPISGDAYSEFDNGCLIAIDYCHKRKGFVRA